MVSLLDALLPPRCPACTAPARDGLCAACARLAVPLRMDGAAPALLDPRIAAIGGYSYDGVVRDAVRGMKLGGCHAAARPLGEQLRTSPAIPPSWPVTWVPSTRRKQRQRGFDLPRLLAGRAALPLLRRCVERPDQTTLDAQARRSSPHGAFVAVGPAPPQVVLVDDVRTTGATAVAAAGALLEAGANRVLVVTLAVGGDDARREVRD